MTASFERTLGALRGAGIRLVADFDDLLFAGDVSGLPASVRQSHGLPQRLAGYAATLDVFDHFIVSTAALATRLLEQRPLARVTVVPNGLSRTWVEQGRALYPRFGVGDRLVLRYFSGSPSHDLDFASILAPLGELMGRHPEVTLELFGPLRLAIPGLPQERVRWLPKVSYDHLPKHLGSTWVNLAPLVPNDFNDCKSAIKFLESGAFGCPTLASKNDDLLRHQELGAPVVLCNDEQDWYRQLQVMLDLDRRCDTGGKAMNHVAANGMASSHVTSWLHALDLGESS